MLSNIVIEVLGHNVHINNGDIELPDDPEQAEAIMKYLETEGFCEALASGSIRKGVTYGSEALAPILIHATKKITIKFNDSSCEHYANDQATVLDFKGNTCCLVFAGKKLYLSNIKQIIYS